MPNTTSYEPWFYRFSAALATRFIGRKKEIAQIQQMLESDQPGLHLIEFSGGGGLGKTRFIEETLKLAENRKPASTGLPLLVAEHLIDFYHYRYHSLPEMMLAILNAFAKNAGMQEQFSEIRSKLGKLSLKRVISVYVPGYQDLQNQVIDDFNNKMREVTRTQRLVLAFDTLEQMAYQDEEISETNLLAESWDWLVKNAPLWGNVTLVLAGRDKAIHLSARMKAQMPTKVLPISVIPFGHEDRLAYFDAAAQAAAEIGDERPAKMLRDLEEKGLTVKYASHGGRPIIFSLLLHLLCLGPVSPDVGLEKTVIEKLIVTPHLGKFVMAMGRMPKGANAHLLACVMDVPVEKAQQLIDQHKNLSFIKKRKEDDRIFLHDELYPLLRKYVYDPPADAISSAIAYHNIDDYYVETIDNLREQFIAPFRAIDTEPEKTTLTTEEQAVAVSALFERQTAMAEQVYYRLRDDPNWGLRAYYRYIREALRGPDEYFSLQLQAELLRFDKEMEGKRGESSEGHDYDDVVHGMVLLFSVVRRIYSRAYIAADEAAQNLARNHPHLFPHHDRNGLHASLQVWHADAIRRIVGREEKAEPMMVEAIAALEGYRKAWVRENHKEIDEEVLKSDFRLWFQTASLAMAHYNLASLVWSQGRLQDAERHYNEAEMLWRDVRVHIELATTINDLSYATSEWGNSTRSKFKVGDGLKMRWRYAPITHISLSRNTQGIIAMRLGNYSDSLIYSKSALRLAHAVEGEEGGRVAGLAYIALSEATRRMVTYSDAISSSTKREQFLQDALEYANRGRAIFQDSPETVNLAAALIEVGCANRDLLRLYRELDRPECTCEECTRRSEEALLLAAEKARAAHNRYREADALVNLGWLGFVAGSPDGYDDHFHAILDDLKEYTFHDGKPPREGLEPLLWTLLGKHAVLHGMMHMAQFMEDYQRRKIDPDQAPDWRVPLRQAARKFTESFEYSARFSKEYPGIQQASQQFLDMFKSLNNNVRSTFVDEILAFEREFGLPKGSSYLYKLIQDNNLLPV